MSHAKLKTESLKQYSNSLSEVGNIPDGNCKKYDLAVVLGRFEPFHVGHQILVNKALMIAKEVLILIGSSDAPRTIKNPFTFEERADMIHESVGEDWRRMYIRPLVDNLYSDDDWISSVQDHVNGALAAAGWKETGNNSVAIVGNKKDESSYYLDLFPQYSYIPVDEVKLDLDATAIREVIFERPGFINLLQSLVPAYTYEFICKFIKTTEYLRLSREYYMIKKYKESWNAAPYSPTFITVDAVMKKSGHLLLVKRKAAPGEGLWALPGGFVEQNERLADAALRELIEETCIDLPGGLLLGSMGEGVVFDHPNRSLRGRTVTHAFMFDLDRADKKVGLPKVKGGDDAEDAHWFPIADVLKMSSQIYEDHLSIIRKVLGI